MFLWERAAYNNKNNNNNDDNDNDNNSNNNNNNNNINTDNDDDDNNNNNNNNNNNAEDLFTVVLAEPKTDNIFTFMLLLLYAMLFLSVDEVCCASWVPMSACSFVVRA